MKMFLTRIGLQSKAVITGDVTQIDLPTGRGSGLVEARNILDSVPGLAFCYFNEADVVRHHLVRLIIKAYQGRAASDRPEGDGNGSKAQKD
jgi:phosphate starvation-inducible PhoH-like protein